MPQEELHISVASALVPLQLALKELDCPIALKELRERDCPIALKELDYATGLKLLDYRMASRKAVLELDSSSLRLPMPPALEAQCFQISTTLAPPM